MIAERCGVQPSAIVRFAQAFGFSGASQMQRLFRDGLLSANSAIGYGERVRRFSESVSRTAAGDGLLAEFVEGNILALQNLSETVSGNGNARGGRPDRPSAESSMSRASAGRSRSPPIWPTRCSNWASTSSSSTASAALRGRRPIRSTHKDLLIAVSFHPYAPETVELAEIAARNGRKILSISDSRVSPIAKPPTVALQVHDSEVRSFRSLAASMCLAQAW